MRLIRVIALILILWQTGSAQNVGIGTPMPGAKLEVAGDLKVNGRIKNVTDPVAAQDAATRNYVDQISEILLNAGLNGAVTDIDGNAYKTIKLGTQVWMSDNLRTTHYNNGTIIPKVTGNSAWGALTTPAYCWAFNDSTLYAVHGGALYNYYTVADTNVLNVCPTGWHVSTTAEWTVLADYLTNNGYGFNSSGTDVGKSMATTYGWSLSPTSGTIGNDQGTNNSSRFNAFPAGIRPFDGSSFSNLGAASFWWCSTEAPANAGWWRSIAFNQNLINQGNWQKTYGYSVRCLRN
jgi:uncharacterized protein (TIGR02145 family)